MFKPGDRVVGKDDEPWVASVLKHKKLPYITIKCITGLHGSRSQMADFEEPVGEFYTRRLKLAIVEIPYNPEQMLSEEDDL